MNTRTRAGVAAGTVALVIVVAGAVLLSTTKPATSGGTPSPSVRSTPLHPAPNAPNILIVVTDDQRQGLGVMPKTRRIFRDGTRYTNAFVSDPLCCPSRASIFTGRYPHNHGVKTEKEATNLVQASTIEHYLQEAGYRTGIYGKYLNSWPTPKPPPFFDKWAIFRASRYGYRNGIWNVNGNIVHVPAYSTGFIGRRADSFLRSTASRQGQPWFLYLATAAPHFPFTPAHKYAHAAVPKWNGDAGTREVNLSDKPPFVGARRSVPLLRGKLLRRAQFRTLMSVDDMMGRLFHQLRRLHEARNTLIFFTSDNGFMWGEHGLKGKIVPYTESIRVPLLARWPGRIPAGEVDRLVSNVDLAPTILDAAGLSADPARPMDGRSLLGKGRPRKAVLTEYFKGHKLRMPSWASLRSHTYQYTEYYRGGRVEFHEYYNLLTDPGELHNVIASKHPTNKAAIRRAAALLHKARTCSGASCP
jgi:arylsulfatase A-like enzyme